MIVLLTNGTLKTLVRIFLSYSFLNMFLYTQFSSRITQVQEVIVYSENGDALQTQKGIYTTLLNLFGTRSACIVEINIIENPENLYVESYNSKVY